MVSLNDALPISGRAKAIKQEDGTWHIEGVKRFITSGDSDDMFENIMHLVLARPEGAGPGTKGLSLFYVPKIHFDFDTETYGDRSEEHTSELQSLMRSSYDVFCLKKRKKS